ncbi:MAG: thioesterase family protein [Thermoguttaceae bacterium]|nr:thioesterase family protein [Thermoguttaceae bacterium]
MKDFTIDVRVRYTECDPMRVVHHSRYLVYFEMARVELFRANGGDFNALEKSGIFFVVVRLDCHYIKPAFYDDVLQVSVHVEKVSKAKMVHHYEIRRNGELLTEANITLALINSEGSVIPIPNEIEEGILGKEAR